MIDRCIVETAINVQWLCAERDGDRFDRYVSDGLKADLRLKSDIEDNIGKRGGDHLVIEDRMLASIDRTLSKASVTPDEVLATKKLPDMRTMMISLGLDEVAYTALQRLGSHSVHGTWTDLVTHYLRVDESGDFRLRDHDVEPHHNQFVYVMIMVLSAMKSFVLFMAQSPPQVEEVAAYVEQMWGDIAELDKLAYGRDFDTV